MDSRKEIFVLKSEPVLNIYFYFFIVVKFDSVWEGQIKSLMGRSLDYKVDVAKFSSLIFHFSVLTTFELILNPLVKIHIWFIQLLPDCLNIRK